jgi:tripartite-type tricarboxylate transporter receptor subunit TctC
VPYLASLLPSYTMWAPLNTPAAIVNKLSSEFAMAIKSSSVPEQMLKAHGAEAVGSTPEDQIRMVNAEVTAGKRP